MASQAATDFLTKEIKVSNNIVTFRLLSRQLSIHVNDAKRELELFHAASQRAKDPVFATYILTGIAAPEVQSETSPEPVGASGHVSEGVPRHLVVLVPEDELEGAKGRFVATPSQHVHSLSPVPLKFQLQEPGLLTSVASRVRQLDTRKGQEHAAQIGMLLSREAPWSGTSKDKPKRNVDNSTKPSAPAKNPPNKVTSLERTSSKVTTGTAQVAKEPVRQNTLNFGGAPKKKDSSSSKMEAQDTAPKAKSTTDSKPASKAKAPLKAETASGTSENASPSSVKSAASKPTQLPAVTTGRTKRILDSSEEDEPAPTQSRPALKRKKSRATSDEDDGSERQSVTTRRRSASLQAMMDIDDDGVINGRSTRSPTPEHVPSAREAAAAAKAAKTEAKAAKAEALKGVDHKERASRKRVPKGKRRVIKTRRVKNAKGYMVTEDYSSYEDIDPNEPDKDESDADTEPDLGEGVNKKTDAHKATTTKSNAQKAGSATGPIKRRQSESSSGAKKTKQTTGKPGQQKIASFFGKK